MRRTLSLFLLRLVLLAFALLAVHETLLADPYLFSVLQSGEYALGINDAGWVAIANSTGGFLQNINSGQIQSPFPSHFFPSGISNNGQVVFGGSPYNEQYPGSAVYSNGAMIPLNVPRALGTYPTGINNSVQVVGLYTTTSAPVGFIYNNGSFANFDGGIPTGVNDAGQVVGNSGASGVLYNNGVLTPINFPGSSSTYVSGINDNGEIVGNYQLPNVTGNRGFVYAGGVFTRVDFTGSAFTALNNGAVDVYPRGINDSGEIVGDLISGSTDLTAFVAAPLASPTPEPASLLLITSALTAAGLFQKRSRTP